MQERRTREEELKKKIEEKEVGGAISQSFFLPEDSIVLSSIIFWLCLEILLYL